MSPFSAYILPIRTALEPFAKPPSPLDEAFDEVLDEAAPEQDDEVEEEGDQEEEGAEEDEDEEKEIADMVAQVQTSGLDLKEFEIFLRSIYEERKLMPTLKRYHFANIHRGFPLPRKIQEYHHLRYSSRQWEERNQAMADSAYALLKELLEQSHSDPERLVHVILMNVWFRMMWPYPEHIYLAAEQLAWVLFAVYYLEISNKGFPCDSLCLHLWHWMQQLAEWYDKNKKVPAFRVDHYLDEQRDAFPVIRELLESIREKLLEMKGNGLFKDSEDDEVERERMELALLIAGVKARNEEKVEEEKVEEKEGEEKEGEGKKEEVKYVDENGDDVDIDDLFGEN